MQPKKSIEYAELSWNPFSGDKTDDGKCEIVNRYGKMACWACGMAYRLRGRAGYDYDDPFKPTFHPDKLNVPLKRKKPTIFATAFMGDICYCKPEWWIEILRVIAKCPQHTFLMLTKDPYKVYHNVHYGGSYHHVIPSNVWMGVTVNKQHEVNRIEYLLQLPAHHHWVSFEPPFEKIRCDLMGIDGIAVGSLTGRHPFMPSYEIVEPLLYQARKDGAKIVIKENLDFEPKLREWP